MASTDSIYIATNRATPLPHNKPQESLGTGRVPRRNTDGESVKVLLIDDDPRDRLEFQRCERHGRWAYRWRVAGSVAEAKTLLQSETFDIVVSGYGLSDGTVFDVLDAREDAQVIVTAHTGNEEATISALRAGAYECLIKDAARSHLNLLPAALARATEARARVLRDRANREADIIAGDSLNEILQLIDQAAACKSPVLITGETGVGKNRVARAIHYRSSFRSAPFVTTNCAALPEHLIEGELFGYEKGAFTGAVGNKKGIFELAEGGTLLLDELGEVPLHIQSKLLGVLDDQQVRRLGSESVRRIDTRVIAATSADLEKSLGKTFRHDLYYRLSVIRIELPPLRARRDDIPALSRHLLKKLNNGVDVEISETELTKLQRYDWPGNIRELKNILERALIAFQGVELRPSTLLTSSATPSRSVTLEATHEAPLATLEEMERQHIIRALDRFAGNVTRAARALGVSISTLKRKKQLYGLG